MSATDTSGVAITYKREAAFGVAPAGEWTPLRITSDEMVPGIDYVESNVIRPDGQIDQVILSDAEGNGSLGGELQYGEWDEFMLAGLLSADWVITANYADTDLTSNPISGTIPANFSRAAGNFVTEFFTVGMWVEVGGFATNPMNSLFKIVGVSAMIMYVQGEIQGAITSESPAGTATIDNAEEVSNGRTINTYAIEREHTDDTDEFHLFTGQGCNGFTIEIPTQGPCTFTPTFLGKVPVSNPTKANTTVAASGSSPTMTAGAEVIAFMEGDPELGNIVDGSLNWDRQIITLLGATINVTPNLRSRKAVGTVGPALAPGRGDMDVTGTLRLYYNATAGVDDKVLMDKLLNDTESGFAIVFKDADLKFYIFEVPRLKFTTGSRATPGKSEDVIIQLEFQGYRNPLDENINANVDGTTMRISRGTWPTQV